MPKSTMFGSCDADDFCAEPFATFAPVFSPPSAQAPVLHLKTPFMQKK
jgi:hypothetical protein